VPSSVTGSGEHLDQERGRWAMSAAQETPAAGERVTVLLYATDRAVREHVRLSIGRKVASDLGEVRVLEVATQPAVVKAMDAGGIDLAILDGEAVPGGMGVCRQLKDEVANCPPVLVLTGRVDDAWLATWSRADGVLPHPVDPMRLPGAVADLVRSRLPRRPRSASA
jgi:DNA-binding response OmpR family regulator